jgi:hypothetical protein
LFTGRGTSGSFVIRGEQLGHAVGGAVQPNALDVAGYSLAVIVKRCGDVLPRLQRADVPIVWDVVDAYPQPIGNTWRREECAAWLRQQIGVIKPVAVVCATQAMRDDVSLPSIALPHHHRPGIEANPIRETVRIVGYEGGEQYIARWRRVIEAECKRRGWVFVVNPKRLADVDIVLALRDQDGYAPRHWKSNVKLANAQGSGTPIIASRELGYLETSSDGEAWADTPAELSAAFDRLTDHDERLACARKLKACAPSLKNIANTYRQWLTTIL